MTKFDVVLLVLLPVVFFERLRLERGNSRLRCSGPGSAVLSSFIRGDSASRATHVRSDFHSPLSLGLSLSLERQHDFRGAALVHRLVPLSRLLKWQSQVEDLPRVDLAVPDELDQVRQEPAHRGRTPVDVNVGEEQFYARDVDLVVDPDEAHMPTKAGGLDRLHR